MFVYTFFKRALSYALALCLSLMGLALIRFQDPGVLYYSGYILTVIGIYAIFRLIAIHTTPNETKHKTLPLVVIPMPEKGWKIWVTLGLAAFLGVSALYLASTAQVNEAAFFYGMLTAVLMTFYVFIIIGNKF